MTDAGGLFLLWAIVHWALDVIVKQNEQIVNTDAVITIPFGHGVYHITRKQTRTLSLFFNLCDKDYNILIKYLCLDWFIISIDNNDTTCKKKVQTVDTMKCKLPFFANYCLKYTWKIS